MVAAIGEAMRQAMEADESVIVMGEDVVGGAGQGEGKENAMGGSFGATRSLFPLFGGNRVRYMPISEAGFVGAGVEQRLLVCDPSWTSCGRTSRRSPSTRSTARPRSTP